MLEKNIRTIGQLILPFFLILSFAGCGSGGGDSPTNNVISDESDRIDDVRALENAPLTSGGSVQLKSTDSAVDGASLIVPPGAVTEDADTTITAASTLPSASPWGHSPVGSLFEIGPSGLGFDSENKALMMLPIPPGGPEDNLYIGRWNEATDSWENVGGSIEGDFISTEVDHLSLYGIFSQGKSLVRIVNEVVVEEDPGDQGIEIRYISGPLPPSDWPEDEPFPAYRALPEVGIKLKIGESQLMMLPPGQYHFAVSFPSPYQISNSLLVRIPTLSEGADDGGIDQTITITGDGASSNDSYTDTSLFDFPGSWEEPISSNQPPKLACSASVAADVAVTNNDPDTSGLPSRRIAVGPILNNRSDGLVKLTGTATDPEASVINYYWTWSGRGTLPSRDVAASGEMIDFSYNTSSKREGRYDVYLTAYDSFHLFDECHWEITVRGNEKPTIEVISDDKIVDFGRFGFDKVQDIAFTLSRDRKNLGDPMQAVALGAPTFAGSWCNYIDINGDGTLDTTLLKTLPILPTSESPDHIYRPLQYPGGMTCLFAMVADADSDLLEVNFRLPHNGDLYNALSGDKITTTTQLDDYNATLSSTMAGFAVPGILQPFAPQAVFALPIIWEAPDNISGVAASDDDTPGHDCRHLEKISDDVGPCIDIPGTFPAGGITTIVAMVTDGFSREQTDYDEVGYGEDDIIRLDENSDGGGIGGGSGTNNPPTCSDAAVTVDQDKSVSVPLSGSDPDGDALSYDIIEQPVSGSFSDGIYTPNGTFSGTDSFTFVANDGQVDSSVCEVIITVNEVRKLYVFKLSGVGYRKTYGAAVKATGYQYDAWWLFPSEVDGIVGTNIDNTAACANDPWPLPSLGPEIWETRNMEYVGMFDSYEEIEPYRCAVPSWVTSNPICNGWVEEYDYAFYDNINSICGS